MGARVADALRAVCGPRRDFVCSIAGATALDSRCLSQSLPLAPPVARTRRQASVALTNIDDLVVRLFEQEGRSLVRLVRLFVDDRNAAEDLVQEGFIRLARNAHRIRD